MSAKLTREHKRGLIAESRGYRHVGDGLTMQLGESGLYYSATTRHGYNCIPDYLGSRDAMAEAIREEIKDIWMHDFIMYLIDKTHKGHGNLSHESTFALIIATPAQLADAYLLTLGLAKEEQL